MIWPFILYSLAQIHVEIDLDGKGTSEITTGVGFFDHMLTQVLLFPVYFIVLALSFFIMNFCERQQKNRN